MMKAELLQLYRLVSLRGGPVTGDVREILEQLLGIICKRDSKEPLAKLACDVLEHMDWESNKAKALYSEDGIWAIIPQRNGTEAFIEGMFWQDRFGGSFAGLALGVLPMRFVYSRLHEQDAVALVKQVVNPPASPNIMRFHLFGPNDLDSTISPE